MRHLLRIAFLLLFASASVAQGTIVLEPSIAGLMKVHATVHGHEGVFLFDSGTGLSNISPAFAATIGCHPWGQHTGFRMTGERLDMPGCDQVAFTLGSRTLAPGTVGVFDLAKLLPAAVGPVDGALGLDILAGQTFTLSLQSHRITLLDARTLPRVTAGLKAVPIHLVRDAEGLALTVNLPVVTQLGTAWFEMDSGNTSGKVLINKPLASLFPANAADQGPALTPIALGDGSTFTGKAQVLDLILDGNLGASFLVEHDVTVDPAHAVAWIAPKAATAPSANSM